MVVGQCGFMVVGWCRCGWVRPLPLSLSLSLSSFLISMVGLCCFSCGNGWIGGLLIGLLWWVLVTVVGLDWVADCCGGSGLLIGLWIAVDLVDC